MLTMCPAESLSNACPAHTLLQTHLLVLTRGIQFDSDDLLRSEACSSVSCTTQLPQLTGCPRGLQCQNAVYRGRVEARCYPI